MDLYSQRLTQMRGYVPFLNKMISKLEKAGDHSKDEQLSKMKSLLGILNDDKKKLRLETLLKCEDVLHKLYEKVEGQQLYYTTPKPHEKYSNQSVPSTPDSPGPSPRSPSPPGTTEGPISSYLKNIYRPNSSFRESASPIRMSERDERYNDCSGNRWQNNRQRTSGSQERSNWQARDHHPNQDWSAGSKKFADSKPDLRHEPHGRFETSNNRSGSREGRSGSREDRYSGFNHDRQRPLGPESTPRFPSHERDLQHGRHSQRWSEDPPQAARRSSLAESPPRRERENPSNRWARIDSQPFNKHDQRHFEHFGERDDPKPFHPGVEKEFNHRRPSDLNRSESTSHRNELNRWNQKEPTHNQNERELSQRFKNEFNHREVGPTIKNQNEREFTAKRFQNDSNCRDEKYPKNERELNHRFQNDLNHREIGPATNSVNNKIEFDQRFKNDFKHREPGTSANHQNEREFNQRFQNNSNRHEAGMAANHRNEREFNHQRFQNDSNRQQQRPWPNKPDQAAGNHNEREHNQRWINDSDRHSPVTTRMNTDSNHPRWSHKDPAPDLHDQWTKRDVLKESHPRWSQRNPSPDNINRNVNSWQKRQLSPQHKSSERQPEPAAKNMSDKRRDSGEELTWKSRPETQRSDHPRFNSEDRQTSKLTEKESRRSNEPYTSIPSHSERDLPVHRSSQSEKDQQAKRSLHQDKGAEQSPRVADPISQPMKDVEQPLTQESVSRPPPPDSPPSSLATPLSPKKEDEDTFPRAFLEEVGPKVIPLERRIQIQPSSSTASQPPRRLSSDTKTIEESPASPPSLPIGPLSLPTPIPIRGPQIIPAQRSPQVIPAVPLIHLPPVPMQQENLPPQVIPTLPVSRFPPPAQNRPLVIPQHRLANAPSPQSGLINWPPSMTPQQPWQRTPAPIHHHLPLQTGFHQRQPGDHLRQFFPRQPGPGPHFNNRHPYGGPRLQRPSTYGEYRKLREDFEKQMQAQFANQYQQAPTPASPSQPTSQGMSTPSNLIVITNAQTPALSKRDPRKPPQGSKDLQKDGGATTESASDSNSDHEASKSSTSKFKIPKKKKQESEANIQIKAEHDDDDSRVQESMVHVKDELGSDSEPELHIAEHDPDDNIESIKMEAAEDETAKKVEKSQKENSDEIPKKTEDSVEDKTSKNDKMSTDKKARKAKDIFDETGVSSGQPLTKEFLSNIISSLEPEEAEKLLMRANMLEKSSKLSLKQLKFLLADDSDDEEHSGTIKEEPKDLNEDESGQTSDRQTEKASRGRGLGRKKSPGKQRPQATPGTRRSSRLAGPTIEPEASAPASVEEENVEPNIRDKEVTRGRGRGGRGGRGSRGRGGSRTSCSTSSHDIIQDDSVSSSTPTGDSQTQPAIEQVQVKVESEDTFETIQKSDDEKEKAVKGPKSKTWFPGSRDAKSQGSGTKRSSLLSPKHSTDSPPLIKVEKKEADLKVFIGPEDLIPEENPFKSDPPTLPQDVSEKVKNRLSTVCSIYERLKKLSSQKEESQPDIQISSVVSTKMSNECQSSYDDIPVEVLVTENPSAYVSSVQSIIERLQVQTSNTVLDPVDPEPENLVHFLDVVKSINKDADHETKNILDDSPKFRFSKDEALKVDARLRIRLGSDLKDDHSLQEMLKPVNLKHLFKCMSQTNCSFTSDNAAKFRHHLEEVHSSQKIKLRHGWLKCCYCLRKLFSPSHLVSHVIKDHGTCQFQCAHCLHREPSILALFLHQHVNHPDKDRKYLSCKSIRKMSESEPKEEPRFETQKLMSCHAKDCEFETFSKVEMSNHLFVDHDSSLPDYADFSCSHCPQVFSSASQLVFHIKLCHQNKPVLCLVNRIERPFSELDMSTDTLSDTEEEEEDESKPDTGGSSNNVSTNSNIVIVRNSHYDDESTMNEGLIGHNLFRCGNQDCDFSAESVHEFKDHVSICEFSVNALYLDCYHCKKPFKHVPTLIDHLKNHGVKRYACSLCSGYSAAGVVLLKNHLRLVHKVSYTKILPVNCLRTNPDEDYFIGMPKNAMPRGFRSTMGSKLKDTFSPDEISEIPKSAILKYLLRCSVCDFVTKVRMNLIKHLRLHLKTKSSDESPSSYVPFITPINQPESEDGSLGFAKMQSLLDVDMEEEKARMPMSEIELAQMPKHVPESIRFACCDKDCDYKAIDEVMLAYHIHTLHPNLGDFYTCPHCPPEIPHSARLPFDELEFHLRCHGEMLFKCGHCLYFHWQKRTAEKHVADNHRGAKLYVRDVRAETEKNIKLKLSSNSKAEIDKKKVKEKRPPPVYQPYKCGLCDFASENLEGIKEHCGSLHEQSKQFKCSLCDMASDSKTDIEKHFAKTHIDSVNSLTMIRIFYVDPTSTPQVCTSESLHEEKRIPLWRRDMPGLKHIRGILYQEYLDSSTTGSGTTKPIPGTSTASPSKTGPASRKRGISDEDNFPMSCRECGLQKKTIKGLKMHIKLLHLRTGRFQCVRCQFSANMLNSIFTHYQIQHSDADSPDFEERSDEGKNFTHEFWKDNWGIPTLQERKDLIASGHNVQQEESPDVEVIKKRRNSDSDQMSPDNRPSAKKMKKRVKIFTKKPKQKSSQNLAKLVAVEDSVLPDQTMSQVVNEVTRKSKDTSVQEISPFENVLTYKCNFCSKRIQDLERIDRHLKEDHPARSGLNDDEGEIEIGYKILSRDQVVDLITMSSSSSNLDGDHPNDAEFICFFCEDVVGTIFEIQSHFAAEHDATPEAFKVKRVQDAKKVVSGYLECQICGYLSPGFDRSKQKVHFHEEHPAELTVNASKYVLKIKPSLAGAPEPTLSKFDASKYIGMIIPCPKSDCSFDTKAMPAMNTHLRRHTQTYKCGHCGKTYPNSSEFHRHSAMSHGNKIPDLVKDPEAEAQFEALRGIVEANLQKAFARQQAEKRAATFSSSSAAKKPRLSCDAPVGQTARKSSGGHYAPPSGLKSVARKSTSSCLKPFTYYRLPFEPVDFCKISTRMSISGMEITLNASKMADIINLKPIVKLKNCVASKRNK